MTRPLQRWDLTLDLSEAGGSEPVFLRIARAITEDIRRGRLRAGDGLPGSRALATSLGVHRNTVLVAYRELLAEGWVEARVGQGTRVSRALPEVSPRPLMRGRRGASARRPTRRATKDQPLGFDLALRRDFEWPVPVPPDMLAMYGGLPDLRLVPRAALARAYRRALRRLDVLQYGDPRGLPRLREALARMLAATRGLAIEADDVVVTRGSQMALALVARTLLRPGDRVAVEALGYPPAWQALRETGAELLPVAVDAQGLRVDRLQQAMQKAPLRAVYLTPHHQYPTTVPLSPARRLALLAWARQARVAIIEDDYDHEFHYEGRPLLPLASADEAGVVIYIGTLSKVLAPGLRVGYVVAPRPLLDQVTLHRAYLDRQGDGAVEAALAELMEDGEVQRHTRRAQRIYRARRDHCAATLRASFGRSLSFRVPQGGMALWCKVGPELDIDAWLQRARTLGVLVQPGQPFRFDGRPCPFVRIGYACLDETQISDAIGRLQRAAVAAGMPVAQQG